MSDYVPPAPKRVIVQHRSAASGRIEDKLKSDKHRENFLTWNRVIQGGVIVCKSYGAAVNERQSLYLTRKLIREMDGQSLWDHLTIKLDVENRDNRLVVETKPSNILEIIPNRPGIEDEAAPSIPSSQAYIIPTSPDEYEEDGRPPLAFEPDAEDVKPSPPKSTE